jgi:FAD:protein FMN transferase
MSGPGLQAAGCRLRARANGRHVVALLIALAATDRVARAEPLVRVEASRNSMACLYAIEAYGADRERLAAILEEALDEVDRLDRLMSHYKPDSPLSRLNREAARGPVIVDRELFGLIAQAIGYSRESDGAFDITVGPLMKAWGFFGGDGLVPADATLARARRLVGYRHVALDRARRTIRFDREGVELDLGGIAKGYAVDRVVAILRARGVTAALVSAGGSTIYGLGAPPGRAGWDVDIQDPLDAREVAFTVTVTDRALSISGASEKSFDVDGVRYTHIMDPRTGRPVTGVLGVIVLAETGVTGDALDNAVFVLGAERSRRLLRRSPRTDALLLLPDGRRSWTRLPLTAASRPPGRNDGKREPEVRPTDVR